MNRFAFAFASLALVLATAGCDKQGLYPYGRRTDVVISCGDPSSVYLRSTDTGTDILIIGNVDPATVVEADNRRCLLVGTVDRDSSTRLLNGSYSLDAAGEGRYFMSAEYEFKYEPNVSVGGRKGSERIDVEYDDPISIAVAGDQLTFTYLDETRTYTAFDTVVAAIDLNDPEGPTDLYQVYNLALFFSQVRIPAFGGLGMTRYITAPGRFDGLISGDYSISVGQITAPHATMTYNTLQDFPRINVFGTQVTKVNINGDGPMEGALSFSITQTADPTNEVFAGNVDYENITIDNGIASSGTYQLNVTSPVAMSVSLPFTLASNVDLRHILPVAP